MFAILSRHVNEYKEKFVTKNITRDLSRLVKAPSGKILAGPGFHDDSIMSYLICMYVLYHGNNLSFFNIHVGKAEAVPTNAGMSRPADEIDTSLVDPALIAEVKKQEEYEKNNYDNLMMETLKRSQQESMRLYKAKLVQNEGLDNTPEELLNDDNEGGIELGFFDDINIF